MAADVTNKEKVPVLIGDRKFHFHIESEHFDKLKRVAGKIQKTVAFYQEKYPDKDMQDILSLVLVDMAMSCEKANV